MRNFWVSRIVGLVCLAPGALLLVGGKRMGPEIAFTYFHDRPLVVLLEVKSGGTAPVPVLSWDFGDGTPPTSLAAPLHTFPRAAQYVVRARITGADGAPATIERSLNLSSPPSIEITGAGEVSTPQGNALWFTAEVHAGRKPLDPGTFVWDFGDGARAQGGRVEHLYSASGNYVVTVTAKKSPTTTLTDRAEVTVSIAAPEPLPLPPPPEPEPLPEPIPEPTPEPAPAPEPLRITTALDFEAPVSSLDGVVFRRVTDPALAHAGTGSLEVNLLQSASFHTALSSAFGSLLFPFLLADRIDAKWYGRWEAPLALDARGIAPTLDAYLAAGTTLTATQVQRLRALAAAVASQLGAGVTLDGQRWYCLTVRYVFPKEGVSAGFLAIAIDGRVLVSLDGLSLLDDGPILEALSNIILTSRIVVSSATKCWADDLVLTTEGVSCP